MAFDTESIDDIKPKWNLIQFGFACIMVIDFRMFWNFIPMMNNYGILALIPYYVFLLLICIPVIGVQLKLGGLMNKGIVGIFAKYIPVLKVFGISVILHNIIESFYYAIFACWSVYYMFASVIPNCWGLSYSDKYPWLECNNKWNLPGCVSRGTESGWNRYSNPSEEFYTYQMLSLSDGVDEPSGMDWPLPICLLVVWGLILLLTFRGVRLYGKILYAVAPLSIACMGIIIIYGNSTLSPSGITADSYKSFYTISNDASTKLSDMWMWVLGFYQHYLSLKLWIGFFPAMGKYHGYGRKRLNMSWLIVLLFYVFLPHAAIITMVPFFGNLAHQLQIGVPDEFIKELGDKKLLFIEPRLLFVSFTEVFGANKDFSAAILFLFFLMLLLYGLQNMALRVLIIIDSFEELFPRLSERKLYRFICTASFCLLGFLLGLPLVTKGGFYLIYLLDSYLYAGLFLTVLFCIAGFVIAYGKQSSIGEVEKLVVIIWFGLAGLISVAFGVMPLIFDREDWWPLKITHYQYVYPWTYVTMGWLVFIAPFLLGIILGTLHVCLIQTSGHISQRIWDAVHEDENEDDFEFDHDDITAEKEVYRMDPIQNRGFSDNSSNGLGRSSSLEMMNRF